MNFQNKTLEKIIRRFKWARTNSIEIFEKADNEKILSYHFSSSKFNFQPVLFEFQCLITTTDTYIRKLRNDKNKQFGVLVEYEKIISKKDIEKSQIKELLSSQILEFELLLKPYSDKDLEANIGSILAIINHEFLHQGELILMLRESGIDLPDRFKKAFAL